MASVRERRGMRRCRSCGSRLAPGVSRCAVCGQAEPWYLTGPGLAAGAAVVAGVLLVFVGALWWRGRDSLATAERPVITPVTAISPSFTPAAPSATGPPTPGNQVLTPTNEAPPTANATPAPVTYTVESGDNLWVISRRLGVDLDALSAANPGATQRLAVGQQLILPLTATPGASAPEGPTPTAAGPSPTPGPTVAPEVYTVQAGDTLATVAMVHGLTVADLVAMNESEVAGPDALLAPGQTLRVRRDATMGSGMAEAVMPYMAPWPLAPASGATVRDDAPLLRWVSTGILPEDVYYVVALRELDPAGEAGVEDLHWVRSNATALAVPARYRPAPGSARVLAWTVTVRRTGGSAPGKSAGDILCPQPEQRVFTWAP